MDSLGEGRSRSDRLLSSSDGTHTAPVGIPLSNGLHTPGGKSSTCQDGLFLTTQSASFLIAIKFKLQFVILPETSSSALALLSDVMTVALEEVEVEVEVLLDVELPSTLISFTVLHSTVCAVRCPGKDEGTDEDKEEGRDGGRGGGRGEGKDRRGRGRGSLGVSRWSGVLGDSSFDVSPSYSAAAHIILSVLGTASITQIGSAYVQGLAKLRLRSGLGMDRRVAILLSGLLVLLVVSFLR